tara:strand:+ start:111 stop:434 length:324 start_codon:yes stop_codon:yes gene_type:complete
MAKANFFERKIAKVSTGEFSEFNHKEENDFIASGLKEDPAGFQERNDAFFDDLNFIRSDKNLGNPVSLITEAVERNFSSREIAFLLAKTIMVELIESAQKQAKENGK